MPTIDDPQHPYYAYTDNIPKDVNDISGAASDLRLIGDDLQPRPTLKRMSHEELADIAHRSENLSPEDARSVDQMREMLTMKGIALPATTTRRSFSINAPWKQ